MALFPAGADREEYVQLYAEHVREESRALRGLLQRSNDDVVDLVVDNPVGLLVVHAAMNLYSGRTPRVRVHYHHAHLDPNANMPRRIVAVRRDPVENSCLQGVQEA